jgi:hypothetical protein
VAAEEGSVAPGFYYSVEDTIRIAYADLDWVNRISKESC